MNTELSILVDRLEGPTLRGTNIIHWSSPVPSFGDLSLSKIATLGLNPSNREFVDVDGNELAGDLRRFHTLNSLRLESWTAANKTHLNLISQLCKEYFNRNPYDFWFKKLDYVISGTSMSYYFPSSEACHLDLIPYATSHKWGELANEEQILLLKTSGDILGLLIKNSPIKFLVLNGQAVVENFENITNVKLKKISMSDWTLPRKSGDGVNGFAYEGKVRKIGGIELDQEILVLGYNHNIQSSYGVTREVLTAIRDWISKIVSKALE